MCTCLYEKGVDKQQIMERTGHQSVGGVRGYKRTTARQREEVSDLMLNCPVKKPHTSHDEKENRNPNDHTMVPVAGKENVGLDS